MSVKAIHDTLRAHFPDQMAIAFDQKKWKSLVEEKVISSFPSKSFDSIATPLTGIVADADIDLSNIIVNANVADRVSIGRVIVSIYIRADGLAVASRNSSYIARYVIEYARLDMEIKVPNGEIKLVLREPQYSSLPPDLSNRYRNDHLDHLKDAHGWTPDMFDTFYTKQEPWIGDLLGASFVGDAFGEFSVFNLSSLFPAINFVGSFAVSVLNTGTFEIVAFCPDSISVREPTDCGMEEVGRRVNGHAEARPGGGGGKVDGVITVGTSGPQVHRRYRAKPFGDDAGEYHVYMSASAIKMLLDPVSFVDRKKNNLIRTGDRIRIGPFSVDHSLVVTLVRSFGFGVDANGPIVDIEVDVSSRAEIGVYLKIGKIRTRIFRASADTQYRIKYYGALYSDPMNGELGFLGEFYDPTNIDYTLDLDGPLGDGFDNVIEWFLNVVCKPVVRLLVTYLLLVVTWPFMSKLATPRGGASYNSPLKIAGYHGDGNEMTVSIVSEGD